MKQFRDICTGRQGEILTAEFGVAASITEIRLLTGCRTRYVDPHGNVVFGNTHGNVSDQEKEVWLIGNKYRITCLSMPAFQLTPSQCLMEHQQCG
jgi:hypothetical protein